MNPAAAMTSMYEQNGGRPTPPQGPPGSPGEEWNDEIDDVMEPSVLHNNNNNNSRDPYLHMNGGGHRGGTHSPSRQNVGETGYDPDTMERVDLGNDPDYLEDEDHSITGIQEHERSECCDLYRNILILACFLIILFPALIIWRETANYKYLQENFNDQNTGIGGGGNAIKPLPSAPPNLGDLCNYDNLRSSAGYQSCEEACEVADCCEFPTTLDLSCVYGNELKCLSYHEQCVKLNYPLDSKIDPDSDGDGSVHDDIQDTASTINVPQAPENLPSICAHDRLTTSDGFAFCRDVCVVARCCYDKEFVPSCTETNDNCDGYAPCLAMSALDKVDNEITQEVNTKCSTDNVLTIQGRDECLDACAHSLCCYAEDIVGPCPTDDSESFCNQYTACQNVFDVTEEQINTLCDPDTGDQGTCMHLCFPARCCFSQGQCFDDVTLDDCDMYQACVSVFPSDSGDDNSQQQTTPQPLPPPPQPPVQTQPPTNSDTIRQYEPDIIWDACKNHNNDGADSGRVTLCDIVCEPGQCCFGDDGSSSASTCTDPTIDCDRYEPCNSKLEMTLEEACVTDKVEEDSTYCVQLCVPAMCCYTIDPDRACYELGIEIECQDYRPCDIIFYGEFGAGNPNT